MTLPSERRTPLDRLCAVLDEVLDSHLATRRVGKLGTLGRPVFPGEPEDAARDRALAPLLDWRWKTRLAQEQGRLQQEIDAKFRAPREGKRDATERPATRRIDAHRRFVA